MDKLKPGVMFWAGLEPRTNAGGTYRARFARRPTRIPGDVPLPGLAAAWKTALSEAGFTIHTVFCAYEGESYADVETVERTVGFVPQSFRSAREARTHAVIDFAEELGAPGIATHIGFVPENSDDPNTKPSWNWCAG